MRAWLIFGALAVVAILYGALLLASVIYFIFEEPVDGFFNNTMVLMVQLSLLATFAQLTLIARSKRPF